MEADSIILEYKGPNESSWAHRFAAELEERTLPGSQLRVSLFRGDTLGARRRKNIKMQLHGNKSEPDTIKLISVILSALSVAIASIQLDLKLNEHRNIANSLSCTLVGPNGASQLRLDTSHPISNLAIKACLEKIGPITHITAVSDQE